MASKKISQREARRWRKTATELQRVLDNQRNGWSGEWPVGTMLRRAGGFSEATLVAVKTARKLEHAVVVTVDGDDLLFWALPLAGGR